MASYKAWLKAAEWRDFDRTARAVTSWALGGPAGRVFEGPTEYPQDGKATALLKAALAIVSRVAPGSALHFISDEASFWRAFPPNENWLAVWREARFEGKPKADADLWRCLDSEAAGRSLTLTAGLPSSPEDAEMLEALKLDASAKLAGRSLPDPRDPDDWPPPNEPAEHLRRRAVEKDPW